MERASGTKGKQAVACSPQVKESRMNARRGQLVSLNLSKTRRSFRRAR